MTFEKKYDDAELIAAYRKYESQIRAAAELGCSRETVARAVRRAGIPLTGRRLNSKGDRAGGGSPRKITDEELIQEAKTMTRAEIAEKHRMCICNIDRKLHRLGIKCVSEYRQSGTGRLQGFGKFKQRIDAAGFGAEYEKGVTLKKVIARDNGICRICGKPVDVLDRTGNRIGNNYPTIDHIKPISKGGAHTWQNVQLAHMICNSYKNAAEVS